VTAVVSSVMSTKKVGEHKVLRTKDDMDKTLETAATTITRSTRFRKNAQEQAKSLMRGLCRVSRVCITGAMLQRAAFTNGRACT
jgi:hypothetical protein